MKSAQKFIRKLAKIFCEHLIIYNFLFFEGTKHFDTCLISVSGGQFFLIHRKICQNIVGIFFLFLQVLNTMAQNVTVADNIQFLALDGNVPNVSATIYAVFGKYLLDTI